MSQPSGHGEGRGRGATRGGPFNPSSYRGVASQNHHQESFQLPHRPTGAQAGTDRRVPIYLNDQSVPPPHPNVTRLEDTLARQGKRVDASLGCSSYGTRGTPVVLRTNYFEVRPCNSKPNQLIIFYRVMGLPDPCSKALRRRIFTKLVEERKLIPEGIAYATDFSQIIVTNDHVIPLEVTDQEYRITISQPSSTNTLLKIIVTRHQIMSVQQMLDYLRNSDRGRNYLDSGDLMQALNIIVMNHPALQGRTVSRVGRGKFYPFAGGQEVKCELGDGTIALRGYYASVRPATGRILVNLNVCAGAFYKPMRLMELLAESKIQNRKHQEKFIRSLNVTVHYKPDGQTISKNTTRRTISGFATKPLYGSAHDTHFRYIDRANPAAVPQEISVYEYYRKQHHITLSFPKLPVINVGSEKRPEYIPMEICIVEPGQAYRFLLTGDQTSRMLTFAARPPIDNAMDIAGTEQRPGSGLRLFGLKGDKNCTVQPTEPFGFTVNTQMITVPGRIIDPPSLRYLKPCSVDSKHASWNLRGHKFQTPGSFTAWQALVINIEGDRSFLNGEPRLLESLFSNLSQSLQGYGIKLGEYRRIRRVDLIPIIPLSRSRDGDAERNAKENDQRLRRVFSEVSGAKCSVAFIVLPFENRWLYARTKYYGDVVFGVHTVHAVGSKIAKERGQAAFFANLALKFNAKSGGVSHTVPGLFAPPLDERATMLMGIDVTHPSPDSKGEAPSIACVVASADCNLAQYPGSIRTQTGKQEMVDHLKDMVVERLKHWMSRNNQLPKSIVLYRDGVSEGQYKQVLEVELPSMEQAFAKLYGHRKDWPKLTILIVRKRHHTRFFPTEGSKIDRLGNPQPGLVVDRGITSREYGEFFLQPHQTLHGTVRPTQYVIIKDDIGFTADQLQAFTHKLCHTYVRSTTAVSLAPPAYYADLLCERGRKYLYSVMEEGTSSNDSNTSQSDWTGDVHPNIRETSWYI